jgi:hypothetical protein
MFPLIIKQVKRDNAKVNRNLSLMKSYFLLRVYFRCSMWRLCGPLQSCLCLNFLAKKYKKTKLNKSTLFIFKQFFFEF